MSSGLFEELNAHLDKAEYWIPVLRDATAEQIMDVLTGLDAAQACVNQLIEQGARYPAEEVQRIEMIESALRRHMGPVVRRLEATGVALDQVAKEQANLPDAWWWDLPRLLRAQRQQMLRTWAKWAAAVVAVVAVAAVLYNTVFAPDPIVVAATNARQEAQDLLLSGDLQSALAAINEGLAQVERMSAERDQTPDTAELLAYRGVLFERMGRESEAAADFAHAEAQDLLGALFTRVQAYLLTDDGEKALAEALRLVALSPEHPAAHMLLGDAYALLNRRFEADDAYARAEQLAFDDEQYASIYVLVKQRRQALFQPVFPQ